MRPRPGPAWFTTGEAAGLCGVTADTVLRWIKRGRLKAERTAGGHHRIPAEEIHPLARKKLDAIPSAPEGPTQPLHCWEYFGQGGKARQECEECVVYRARATLCFRLAETGSEAGYAGRYCRTTCDECVYYQRIRGMPVNVLVISADKAFVSELRDSGNLKVRHARNGYEAAALIQEFRPGFVIIDSTLKRLDETELVDCLANDARAPGLKVILAVRPGSKRPGWISRSPDVVVGVLPKPFGTACLESLIASVPVPSNPADPVG